MHGTRGASCGGYVLAMTTPASTDPIQIFLDVRAEARSAGEPWDATSASLATVDADGNPDVRVVLVKEVGPDGLRFYTNRESDKGRQLAVHPYAAVVFHFDKAHAQFRFRGRVQQTPDADGDAYFASRPRISQLGAWASLQSTPIAGREVLEGRLAEFERRFEGVAVSRPPHWGGYLLVPDVVEHWVEGAYRLHDRWRYVRTESGWNVDRLSP